MKKTILICSLLMATIYGIAQPSWVKNASKSVFTLKTFSPDGQLIASCNGFYTGTNGEAVSSFSPFKGASKAVIIDSQGKEWEVSAVVGVNEMYDVAKFRVNNHKSAPLSVTRRNTPEGSQAWVLPYRAKSPEAGSIMKTETFMDNYAYYTVNVPASEKNNGCPLFNEAGEVIGMIQSSASDKDTLSYAVSALFADSLTIKGVMFNDPVLKQTKLKKELPADIKEANVALYLSAAQMDSAAYVGLIQDFIQQFPNSADGYVTRANLEASNGDFAAAERDMDMAIKLAEPKDEVHFTYARMIYNKEIYQSAQPYANWSLDKSLQEIQTAYQANPQPTYRQLEANILFAQQKYDEAYNCFMELTNSNLRSAEIYYAAARCKEMQKDTVAMLALMDSTIATFSKPYLKEAAPYIWARAEARRNAGKYRDAISDMNEYETLMSATINDNFYYIRHQTEIQGRLYQQALNDINRAIQINPKEILYYAEKASLEIRVGMYEQAIQTADECLKLDNNNSDGYLFKGLAQCLKGDKTEGIKNLNKARELGDTQANALIEKYK
ncbi:MAG: hypothetical protein IJ618_04965 [Prevotella sp.]|nr:hypothetical protein [Prevotella sp.]